MATAREHIAADMAWLFAEPGGAAVDLVVDGVPLRAVPRPDECLAGEMEGQLLHRLRYLFLSGSIAARIGEEKEIDGRKWRVVSLAEPLGLLDLTLERVSA